jgi:outer membrane lipoprotein SlyB
MRTSTRILSMASAVAMAAALAACGTPDPYGSENYPVSQGRPGASVPYGSTPGQNGYVEYGRITNVALISQGTRPGNATAGTVLGAVAGGLLGNQIGHGGGRAAATILGAVGGAAVGNRIAGGNANGNYANNAGPVYRVSVQTDNGQFRTYDVSATGDLRPGDRVRIENGVIYLS